MTRALEIARAAGGPAACRRRAATPGPALWLGLHPWKRRRIASGSLARAREESMAASTRRLRSEPRAATPTHAPKPLPAIGYPEAFAVLDGPHPRARRRSPRMSGATRRLREAPAHVVPARAGHRVVRRDRAYDLRPNGLATPGFASWLLAVTRPEIVIEAGRAAVQAGWSGFLDDRSYRFPSQRRSMPDTVSADPAAKPVLRPGWDREMLYAGASGGSGRRGRGPVRRQRCDHLDRRESSDRPLPRLSSDGS